MKENKEIFNFNAMNISEIVNYVANAVASTLGPKGKYMIIGDGKTVYTTKDGVSCLRLIASQNPYIQNVISILREGAENTLKVAGDGTTSTVVITAALLQAIEDNKISIANMSTKIDQMIAKIPEIATPIKTIEDIKKVANTSLSGDEKLASIISEALDVSRKMGLNGENVTVEIKPEDNHRIDVIDGVTLASKPVTDTFTKDGTIDDTDVLPICYAGKIESEREIVGFIDHALQAGYKKVALFAYDYAPEVVGIMTINKLQNVCDIYPFLINVGMKNVDNLETVRVLSASVNAIYCGQDVSMRLDDIDFTQECELVKHLEYSKGNIKITGIKDTPVDDLINKYKGELDSAFDEELYKYQFFLGLLNRKMIKIVIGAHLLNRGNEIKDRIDDAIQSVFGAIKKGKVPGAGESYNLLNKKTSMYEKFFAFQSISKIVGEVNEDVFDSALTLEAVLKTTKELVEILANTSFVVDVNQIKG